MQDLARMVYVLVETDDTSSLSSPIKTTNRIKFLCFAASNSFLVFGATSGGLYVFDRESYAFISLIPNKEGPVTCVKISPDEKWFGFATSRGISCALEHSGSSVNRRILSHEHEAVKVTALEWNSSSTQLYVGDETGRISVISVASYLTPAVALMQLDSSIVQLDSSLYMLIASTKTRSYLCDTFREQYRQIGTRLRDGDFGACFYHVDSPEVILDLPPDAGTVSKDTHGPFSSSENGDWLLADKHLQNLKLFCARPGLRLWEVRVDGAVMSTHQFKQLLSTPPVGVVSPPSVGVSPDYTNGSYRSDNMFQFTKLFKIADKFILTLDSNGMFVLDPMTSEVILWTDHFKDVVDVCVVGELIYVWMGGCKLHAVSLLPMDKFLVRMYLQKQYLYCSQFCAAYFDSLKNLASISSKMYVLVDLLEKMKKEKQEMLDAVTLSKTSELLAEVSKKARNQEQAQMLNSGIFIVGNAHLLSQKENLRILKPHNKISNKLQANKKNLPDLPTDEDAQLKREEHVEKDSVFKKYTPEQSPLHSDEDFDPFPDLPLSSLASVETVIAFKNLTTTVSGTISNGTSLLKEKWQSFEEKLRGQEDSCLSVEKSVNRLDARTSNLYEMDGNEDKNAYASSQESRMKLLVSRIAAKCQVVVGHQNSHSSVSEEFLFEMLNGLAVLYEECVNYATIEPEECKSPCTEEQEVIKNFGERLNFSEITALPFNLYFQKDAIVTLSLLLHDCLRTGTLVKWLSPFLTSLILDHNLFPSHVGSNYSEESLILDQALGRTLKVFSHLLDPYSVLQTLNDSDAPCHFFTWNVIMDHFYSSPTTVSDEKSTHTWPLPRKLNAMLVMLQLGQVESCRSIGEDIPLKHVLRTVLRLKDDSHKVNTLVLSYLDKVPVHKLQKELEDMEVFYFTKHAFESINTTDPDCLCACGFPLCEVKHKNTFIHVGQTLLTIIYQNKGLSDAHLFCQSTGVLWYFFLSLRRSQKIDEVLPLILQVCCEEELDKRCCEFSPSTWELLFKLRSQQEQGYCLQCNARLKYRGSLKSLPWTTAATMLIRETNGDFSMKLLSTYSHSIPAGSLKVKFYQSCLLASLAERQGVELKKKLLEAFADYSTLPAISSELAQRLDLPSNHDQHQWGLKLKLSENNCLFCMISLSSSLGGFVISFCCSHSFHSVCLQQRLLRQCPICS